MKALITRHGEFVALFEDRKDAVRMCSAYCMAGDAEITENIQRIEDEKTIIIGNWQVYSLGVEK